MGALYKCVPFLLPWTRDEHSQKFLCPGVTTAPKACPCTAAFMNKCHGGIPDAHNIQFSCYCSGALVPSQLSFNFCNPHFCRNRWLTRHQTQQQSMVCLTSLRQNAPGSPGGHHPCVPRHRELGQCHVTWAHG